MKRQYYQFCKYCGVTLKNKMETPLCGLCACSLLYGGFEPNTNKGETLMGLSFDAVQYSFVEKGDKLTGKFCGVAREPWPSVLIDDGGCVYSLGLTYTLKEFFKNTRLPVNTFITVTFQGKQKTNSGYQVNILKIDVDEKTLPKSYDKNQLKPLIINPATDDVDWNELYETQQTKGEDKQQEDIPF